MIFYVRNYMVSPLLMFAREVHGTTALQETAVFQLSYLSPVSSQEIDACYGSTMRTFILTRKNSHNSPNVRSRSSSALCILLHQSENAFYILAFPDWPKIRVYDRLSNFCLNNVCVETRCPIAASVVGDCKAASGELYG